MSRFGPVLGPPSGQIESPTVGAGAAAFTTAPVMLVGVLGETKIPRLVVVGAHWNSLRYIYIYNLDESGYNLDESGTILMSFRCSNSS